MTTLQALHCSQRLAKRCEPCKLTSDHEGLLQTLHLGFA